MPPGMIEIRYNDTAVRDALRRLRDAGADMSPAMRDIAAALEADADRAFDDEASPDGTPWEPLRQSTIDARKKRRKWPGQILQRSARLARSLTSDSGDDYAAAGTNVIYGALHQFGAKRGAFGRTRRGAPIPWGDVP